MRRIELKNVAYTVLKRLHLLERVLVCLLEGALAFPTNRMDKNLEEDSTLLGKGKSKRQRAVASRLLELLFSKRGSKHW